MTIFFAATTAAGLIGLAAFTDHNDSSVRDRTDHALTAQAKLFSGDVTVDRDGGIDVTSTASGANLAAVGSMPAAFIDSHGIVYATPTQSALPSSSVIDTMFSSMAGTNASVFATATGPRGQLFRWVGRPIPPFQVGAVPPGNAAMALVGTPMTLSFSHDTLTRGLLFAVVVLVVAASGVGHLLSGWAMRPALRQVEQQEQFLREAAHEIRTPLTTLRLIAESGLRNCDTERSSLQAILDRLSTMNTVVSTLLMRARIESGLHAIDKQPLRLDQLVEVTIDDLRLGDRVAVTTSDTIITGNAELLAQAVRNLVDNAIRHGGDGPVQVTVADRRITVTDQGSRRGTAAAPSLGTTGTGTGLAIVKWAAEQHSAQFDLTMHADVGTQATLSFHQTATNPNNGGGINRSTLHSWDDAEDRRGGAWARH